MIIFTASNYFLVPANFEPFDPILGTIDEMNADRVPSYPYRVVDNRQTQVQRQAQLIKPQQEGVVKR